MARLPTPGGDSGTWGDLLNEYLSVSLDSTGTLKSGTVGDTQISSVSQAKVSGLSSALAGKVDANAVITAGTKTKITYGANGLVTAGDDASQDDIIDGLVYKRYSSTEKTKLAGVQDAATANQTDAYLLSRANHTGTQAASTISDFTAAVQAVSLPKTLQAKLMDDATTVTVASGLFVFAVSADLNGRNLTSANAYVSTASTSGAPTIQIRNISNSNVAMLSTAITIDANETTSYTAATPAVVNTANDNVATGNLLAVDVSAAGTGAKGLGIILTFEAP